MLRNHTKQCKNKAMTIYNHCDVQEINTIKTIDRRWSKIRHPDLSNMTYLNRFIMNFYIQFCCFNGEPCSYAVILKFIDFINLQYFIKKLQHNANIPQSSHFLYKFSITVVKINKIDLTLTSNLTITLT